MPHTTRFLILPLLTLLLTLVGGCGYLAAPISIPLAIAENRPFEVRGVILDEQGAPLTGITMKYCTITEIWNPLDNPMESLLGDGIALQENWRTRTISSDFHLKQTTGPHGFQFEFSKPGYYPRKLSIAREEWVNSWRSDPDTQFEFHNPHIKVVLLKQGDFTSLVEHFGTLWLMSDGSLVVLSTEKSRPDSLIAIGPSEKIPPGYLSISATFDENHFPTDFQLRISGEANGIRLFTPQYGYPASREMRTAPADQYAPEVRLENGAFDRLGHREKAWFYIKSGDCYGRASVEITSRFGLPNLSADIHLYMQPNHSQNLETTN